MNIGEKVIVRSNADEPLLIGYITRFENFGGKASTAFPVVDSGAGEMIVMGIARPFSFKLMDALFGLAPREQWAYLVNRQ